MDTSTGRGFLGTGPAPGLRGHPAKELRKRLNKLHAKIGGIRWPLWVLPGVGSTQLLSS